MQKEFIEYTEALALKELGFDEPCFGYWFADKVRYPNKLEHILSQERCLYITGGILAPTHQQALRFFREKYSLDGHVTFRESSANKIEGINSVYYDIEIYNLMGGDAYKTYKFKEISDNKEEAELACVKKLIEICKTKNI